MQSQALAQQHQVLPASLMQRTYCTRQKHVHKALAAPSGCPPWSQSMGARCHWGGGVPASNHMHRHRGRHKHIATRQMCAIGPNPPPSQGGGGQVREMGLHAPPPPRSPCGGIFSPPQRAKRQCLGTWALLRRWGTAQRGHPLGAPSQRYCDQGQEGMAREMLVPPACAPWRVAVAYTTREGAYMGLMGLPLPRQAM